jgi:hypothetical protein
MYYDECSSMSRVISIKCSSLQVPLYRPQEARQDETSCTQGDAISVKGRIQGSQEADSKVPPRCQILNHRWDHEGRCL